MAKKPEFSLPAFVSKHEQALEQASLSRKELSLLLNNYLSETSLEAIGGCQICMQPLGGDEDTFNLPGCGHLLHKTCFLEVVTTSLGCPVCKRNVRIGLLSSICEKTGGFSPVLNTTFEAKNTFEDE